MLIIPSGVKIHLALGRTDMRKGFDSLAVLVQEVLKKDPFSGHLFAFRGKKGRHDKDPVPGWERTLPVPQAAAARPLRLAFAVRAGRHGDAHASAAHDAD
jgi:IS66 Orf2 like protein